ncbi:carboxylate/amino acid/amine transporter [Phaeobacter piscinae]|uniref:Carboxylate/amino acid/amine transporter n=1 Tax=Phaeobacter piscinae TaxID=1580596 RepID=A0ABM6PAM6_9RHOB|nr:DMT family transporter [Phaeobacter piscinae]ATG34772.1 carboxylate/amino acid/amine transporter [Phaeobacter piscinae]AUQ85292.1 carboxylate/amino acid/amine transporter [Phaeobacter piscinae]AUR23176.1 carboxylate/amino acid/amine transporter [Phaeobacter piscinae]
MKLVLLILLGCLWSVHLAAMKSAGQSGLPPLVVAPVSILGIAFFYSAVATACRKWPPLRPEAAGFYVLSGFLGFVLPFLLEVFVAPKLPLFIFVVIISTMPIFTTILAVLAGVESVNLKGVAAVLLGFGAAIMIVWDTAELSTDPVSWDWFLAAFAVPTLYAVNTVFVASRWPKRVDAISVAHGQALVVAMATLAGSIISGSICEWHLVTGNIPAIGLIGVGEGLTLLVYLNLARDYGPSLVSLANFISLFFAAIIGAVFFDDGLTWLSALAGVLLVTALTLRNQESRGGT